MDAACRSVAASAGRQLCLLDPDPGAEPDAQDRRGCGRPGRGDDGVTSRVTSAATATFPVRSAARLSFVRGHPAEGGQVGPLVLVRLEGFQVQEHGRAVVPGRPEQRRGDQVADPADREQVLGGEQPVVTGQRHPPAERHRLAQQSGAQAAGQSRPEPGR